MRLTNNSTPKYRRHKVSGRAIVTLDNHDCYLGPYGSAASRAEYDRVIAEWLAAGRRLTKRDDNLNITEMLAAYNLFLATYYVKNRKPTGEQDCVKAALRPLRRLYGRTPAAEFGPMALFAQHPGKACTTTGLTASSAGVLPRRYSSEWDHGEGRFAI